ncbi:MAG: LOG family protein [Phycisphaeraceae bacterium]|nr:LOG family protein [Phycisphaeraceae bacterium]
MTHPSPQERALRDAIASFVRESTRGAGRDAGSLGHRRALASDLVRTTLRLVNEGFDIAQLRLISLAVREMRSAYQVFNRYRGVRKVSIFGSARTPPDHPDYVAARDFGAAIAAEGWMAITGAGDGIMRAGHEGPQREASFGLSIRLPFETNANEFIQGDPKLLDFRYFFTRKLMFVSHSDAVAVFPGGFGTMDEIFEVLTLVQTGKSPIVPIVLVEGAGADGAPLGYWPRWEHGCVDNLLQQGWISPEDPGLYQVAQSPLDAVDRILRFYRRYHSSRYVDEHLVIRMKRPLSSAQVLQLDHEFKALVRSGAMTQQGPLEQEDEFPQLPRLVFHHTKRAYGLVRKLIDRINELPEEHVHWP